MDELHGKLMQLLDSIEDVRKIISVFNEDSGTYNSRVKLVVDQLKTHNLLPFKKAGEKTSDKSSDKSIEYRNLGNLHYVKKDWMPALSYYTQSIAAAPYPDESSNDGSKEIAVAFANRSAALFSMAKYEACLADIEKALNYQYPEYLVYKLMERRAKCLQYLGRFHDAALNIQKSIDSLPLAYLLSKAAIDETEQRLKSLFVEISLKTVSCSDPPEQSTAAPTQQLTVKKPEFIGNVLYEFKEDAGRCVVAGRDIMPGELIVAEDPYAAILLPGFFSTHCFNCLQRFHALIPCKTCSLAMFCTEKCYEEAWENHHRIECPVLSKLFELNINLDWMLALRLLLVASHKSNGLSSFLEKINKFHDNTSDVETLKSLFANDPCYVIVHSLVNNLGKRTFNQVHKLAVGAVCIVNCLDAHTDIFSFKEDACSGDKHSLDPRIVTGGLLLHYIQSVQCNSYSTAELLFDTKQANVVKIITMGSAIYKLASVINHSCNPNVLRSNYRGSSMSLVAFMPIKKGEEICSDYGYQFSKVDRATRKAALLERYFFECKCEACENDWPLAFDLDVRSPTFLCPECKVTIYEDENPASLLDYGNLTCRTCKMEFRFRNMWLKCKPIIDGCYFIKGDLLAGGIHDFTPELRHMVMTLHSLLQKPSRLLLDVQDAFRHWVMQMGNFYLTC